MKLLKLLVKLVLLLGMLRPAQANDVKSCEISLAPKGARVIEDTFYNNGKLAEKFISVLIEENNLFFGSALLGYFDLAMVKHGHLKAGDGMSTTALTTHKFRQQNLKSLKKFEQADQYEKVVIAKEIWSYLETDLELNQPEIVNGKDVFSRMKEKLETDGMFKGLNRYQEYDHVVKLVNLRATLKEIINYPGGKELLRAFIVYSLPMQARFLAELQIHPKRQLEKFNTIIGATIAGSYWTVVGIGMVLGDITPLGMSLMGGTFIISSTSALWQAIKADRANSASGDIKQEQCKACDLLAKGLRGHLEKSGLLVNQTTNSAGLLEVRSLDVPKLSFTESDMGVSKEKLKLSHPLSLSDINSFGLILIREAQELSKEAETLETSYESGISYVIKGKDLKAEELRHRLQFRYEQIQHIQSYLQEITDRTEAVRAQLQEAVEYVKENVDTFAHKDNYMNENVAKAMEAQAKTLDMAEQMLSISKQKLVSLSSCIIRESNLINAIYLKSGEVNIDPQIIKEYVEFLSEHKDLNVEDLMQVLQLDQPLLDESKTEKLHSLPPPQKAPELDPGTEMGLKEIERQKTNSIEVNLKTAKKILGRDLELKYLENIIFEVSNNNLSLKEALSWFKSLEQYGSQARYRGGINGENLNRLLPLLADQKVSPKQIMDHFFEIDFAIGKIRKGRAISEGAVATLVLSSINGNKRPEEMVSRFFSVLSHLELNHSKIRLGDLELSHLVELSFRHPESEVRDLLDQSIRFYQLSEVGKSTIPHLHIISLLDLMLQKGQGPILSETEMTAVIQKYDSLKSQLIFSKLSSGEIVELLWLSEFYYQSTSPDLAELFTFVYAHTRNNHQLSVDVIRFILNRRASSKTTSAIQSKDVLEALFILKDRGHKLRPDEFIQQKGNKGAKI